MFKTNRDKYRQSIVKEERADMMVVERKFET